MKGLLISLGGYFLWGNLAILVYMGLRSLHARIVYKIKGWSWELSEAGEPIDLFKGFKVIAGILAVAFFFVASYLWSKYYVNVR